MTNYKFNAKIVRIFLAFTILLLWFFAPILSFTSTSANEEYSSAIHEFMHENNVKESGDITHEALTEFLVEKYGERTYNGLNIITDIMDFNAVDGITGFLIIMWLVGLPVCVICTLVYSFRDFGTKVRIWAISACVVLVLPLLIMIAFDPARYISILGMLQSGFYIMLGCFIAVACVPNQKD